MKFLIDECLHTSFVAVAQENGHDGFHINWLGLSGEKDWDLMPRVVAEDYTFVTNNARDLALSARSCEKGQLGEHKKNVRRGSRGNF